MIEFRPVSNAPLTIYERPEDDTEYCVGIDTATGVASDYTVMQVLSRRIPFEQVAVFRAKWSVVDAAAFADVLGRYYNNALIICETNYPGNAVQDALIQTYTYSNCYKLEEHLDDDPNISSKFGWKTTQASKWLLIREMQKALKENEIIFHHKQTLEELGTFVYVEDRTKTGAAQGLNDDCVIAIMLAYHAAMMYPQDQRKTKKGPTDQNRQHRAMMDRFMSQFTEEKQPVIL